VPLLGLARGNKKKGPPQGAGQGNGAAPAMWAVVSKPMLEVMQEEGFCTIFEALISDEEIRFVGYTLVDDTDLILTAKLSTDTFLEVANEMQGGLDLWEGLLKVTGGAIVPFKSFWYLIDFEWKEGKWAYKSSSEAPATLTVKDLNGECHTLTHLEPHEARHSLGVQSAPDGNNKEQVEYLWGLSEEWREKIRTGHLSKHNAWMALTTRIM